MTGDDQRPPPAWLAIGGFGWLAALVSAPVVGTVIASAGRVASSVLLTLAGIGAAATLVFGAALAWSRPWRQLGVAAVCGTAALMTAYVFAMVT